VRQGLRAQVSPSRQQWQNQHQYLINWFQSVNSKGSFPPRALKTTFGVPLTTFPADQRQDYLGARDRDQSIPARSASHADRPSPISAVLTNCAAKLLDIGRDPGRCRAQFGEHGDIGLGDLREIADLAGMIGPDLSTDSPAADRGKIVQGHADVLVKALGGKAALNFRTGPS